MESKDKPEEELEISDNVETKESRESLACRLGQELVLLTDDLIITDS